MKKKLNPDFNAILDFWFLDLEPKNWFEKNLSLDQSIKEKFLLIHQNYRDYKCDYENTYEVLAFIILFDQFSRNIFRNTKLSFEFDFISLNATKKGIEKNLIDNLKETDEQKFFLMPLMHSEVLKDQKLSVELFKKFDENTYNFAVAHYNIIEKFGRFPHRNKILDRESSKEELDFLKQPNSSF